MKDKKVFHTIGLRRISLRTNLPKRKAIMSTETRTLTEELKNSNKRLAYGRFVDWVNENHREEIEKELRRIFISPYNENKFEEYFEEVLADKPISTNFGWFEDIVGTVNVILDRLFNLFLDTAVESGMKSEKTSSHSGLDIYELAKDPMYQNADYYDLHSGMIYQTAAYNRAKKFGLPTLGIGVVDGSTGELLGYAKPIGK
jgi:hypothetical protein